MNRIFWKFKFSGLNVVLWILFGLIFFYNFHKYIFKYGDTGTSPTYSDTPFIWKFSKYVIFMFVCVYMSFKIKNKFRLSHGNWLFLFLISFNLLALVFFYFFSGQIIFDEFEYIIWFILYLILLLIDQSVIDNMVNFFNDKAKLFVSALVLFNIIAILNFILFKRLPALGYEDGLVRFGGGWDDPNGFGFLCSVFAALAIERKWWLILVGLVLSIILTVSLSTYLDLILVLILTAYRGHDKINYKRSLIYVVLFIGLVFILFYFENQLLDLYSIKKGSIDEHIAFKTSYSFFASVDNKYLNFETWLWGYLINFTPVSIIGVIFIFCYWLKMFLSKKRDFFSIYIIVFIFGNLFIPLIKNFPVNLLFFVFLAFDQRINSQINTNIKVVNIETDSREYNEISD